MNFKPTATNAQITSQQSIFGGGQFGQARPESTGRPLAERQAADISNDSNATFTVGDTIDIKGVDGVEAPSFEPLPEGIYYVTVTKVEHEDYFPTRPDAKLPACEKMVVKLKVMADDGRTGFARANFFFVKRPAMLKKLYDFYISVGAMQPGDTRLPLEADVEGSVARAKIVVHEYNGRKYNEVHYFLAPSENTESTEKVPF